MFEYNTMIAIDEFSTAIKTKSNKKIEETTVIKLLDYIIEGHNTQLYSTLPKGTILYRSRQVDTTKAYKDAENGINAYFDDNKHFVSSGYSEYESKEAPLSVATAGRNNVLGMSYMYLSDDPYTSCCEIKPNIRSLVSVAKFRIKSDMNILNLFDKVEYFDAFDFAIQHQIKPSEIMNNIFSAFSRLVTDESQYYMTQYISDYIRKAGFDGIKYHSSINYKANYTIFNSHKSRIEFVESKLVAIAGIRYDVIDLDKETRMDLPDNMHSFDNIPLIQKGLVDLLKEREKNNAEPITT